jgi:sterol desaturase/sphingolipid hydroxylase (fatty acid hydroxylase superfamily)
MPDSALLYKEIRTHPGNPGLHGLPNLTFLHFYLPVYLATFAGAGVWTFLLARTGTRPPGRWAALAHHLVPLRRWASRSTKVDIGLYLASKLVMKWIAVLSTIIAVCLAAKAGDMLSGALHGHVRAEAGPGAIMLICLAMLIFDDFGNYLSHLLQHKILFLWQFHKVHHAATFLTPLTTYRFHPVGNLIDGIVIGACLAVPVGAAAFFYQLDFPSLLAMSATTNVIVSIFLLDLLQHTHFSISFGVLDRVLISPRMHQVHHSMKKRHWGKNLGSKLSVWDWCFGTAYRLPPGEELDFGMGTGEDPNNAYASVWWSFAGPFVDCAKLAGQTWRRRRGGFQNAPQPAVLTTPAAS